MAGVGNVRMNRLLFMQEIWNILQLDKMSLPLRNNGVVRGGALRAIWESLL